MSFIGTVEQGKVYAPGYFLAHEECERKTRQIAQRNMILIRYISKVSCQKYPFILALDQLRKIDTIGKT